MNPIAQATAAPGTGLLEIVRGRRRSVVSRAYATSPLRLLTPANHGTAAWIYAASYGGGLVGGDDLCLTVRVGPDAAAFLSTQSSTKIYGSTRPTSVHVAATVEDGGQLVMWPDPVVCFAGSVYRQRQHVALADGATLVLVDWMSSGRRASGERWQFSEYSSRLDLRYGGRLVLVDSTRLSPAEGALAERMGRFDVLASITLAGPQLQDGIANIAADVAAQPIVRNAAALVAVAPIAGGAGCLLRVAGRSAEQVGGIIQRYLSFVSGLLRDDPWARKW